MDQESLSKKKYKLALIDPPYLYDNMQQNDPKRGGITYSTMSLKDLSELPISNIMDDNSVIVVWVTFPKLCDTYEGKYDAMSMIRSSSFAITRLNVRCPSLPNNLFNLSVDSADDCSSSPITHIAKIKGRLSKRFFSCLFPSLYGIWLS